LGDTEFPSIPWQFEQTCCAVVTAGIVGSLSVRERSGVAQAAQRAAIATARVTEVVLMVIS
jgi:hypothetical protein